MLHGEAGTIVHVIRSIKWYSQFGKKLIDCIQIHTYLSNSNRSLPEKKKKKAYALLNATEICNYHKLERTEMWATRHIMLSANKRDTLRQFEHTSTYD